MLVTRAAASPALVALALLAVADPALGHDGGAHAAPAPDIGDPLGVGAVAFLAAAYVAGAHRLRRRGAAGPGARHAAFLAGCALAAAAALPPLHGWAHDSLSGHMVQHLILIAVAAPLIALARPSAPLLWSLPGWARRPASRVPRAIGAAGATGAALLAASAAHAAVLVVWHLPGPYDAALRSPMLHRAEHATMLLSAVVVWWGIAAAWRRRGALCAAGIGSAAGGLAVCGVIGLVMMFAPAPWYDGHDGVASALADQQTAGALMWGPGGLAYGIAAALLTARLLQGAGHAPAPGPPYSGA